MELPSKLTIEHYTAKSGGARKYLHSRIVKEIKTCFDLDPDAVFFTADPKLLGKTMDLVIKQMRESGFIALKGVIRNMIITGTGEEIPCVEFAVPYSKLYPGKDEDPRTFRTKII
jgi:hypothetical protein